VVGCDGRRSSIREAIGIPFEGEIYPQSFVLADVRMEWRLPDDEVQLFFSPDGLVVVAPLPHGRHCIVATIDEAPSEPVLADVQALLDARGPRALASRQGDRLLVALPREPQTRGPLPRRDGLSVWRCRARA
jgi:2-polyprenyl-6-methoxyphenol hydroxylase-like FAD-dependent oxidoreductase